MFTINRQLQTLILLINILLLTAMKLNSITKQASKVMSNSYGSSLVICGPSGVGKGTLITRLLEKYPSKIGLSVSYTSRLPRPNEVNGIHYHFVTKDYLINDINNGTIPYIEWALVHNNYYGTRKDEIEKVHALNRICLLDVDVNGVKSIKEFNLPKTKMIFIAPPSLSLLEERLRNRKTESEEQINIRISNARSEIEYGTTPNNFDYILVNDNIEIAFNTLENKLKSWYPDMFIE